MSNYQKNITRIIKYIEIKLSEKCNGIKVVLAQKNIAGMITPDDNSEYIHVYLLNVPGDVMLELEDYAYDIWEDNTEYSVSFFMYTPQETKERFPAYATNNVVFAFYINAISLKTSLNWTSNLVAANREDYKLDALLQASAQVPKGSTQTQSDIYQPQMNKNITTAADTQLALAA